MLRDATRTHVIQGWCAAVTMVLVAGIALGAPMTIRAGAILLSLSMVPPVIVFLLWPGAQRLTTAAVIYRAGRRP